MVAYLIILRLRACIISYYRVFPYTFVQRVILTYQLWPSTWAINNRHLVRIDAPLRYFKE